MRLRVLSNIIVGSGLVKTYSYKGLYGAPGANAEVAVSFYTCPGSFSPVCEALVKV